MGIWDIFMLRPPGKIYLGFVSLQMDTDGNGILQQTQDTGPDSKVHGANMVPIWGRHDPRGPHVGPMNFIIWGAYPMGANILRSLLALIPEALYTKICQQMHAMGHAELITSFDFGVM